MAAALLQRVYFAVFGSDLHYCYLVFIDRSRAKLKMQAGETVDWQFLPYASFKEFIHTAAYAPASRERFLTRQALFDQLIQGRLT